MKHASLVLLFIAAFFAHADNNTNAECFNYSDTIQLAGTIHQQMFPGPPNYENIKTGDTAERYWILYLETPICVLEQDDINIADSGQSKIQLVVDDYAKYRKYLSQPVIVTGTFFHAINRHHHTNILLQVTSIQKNKR